MVPLTSENHNTKVNLPVECEKDSSMMEEELINPSITIQYYLPNTNFTISPKPKPHTSYHLFFTYPEPYFPNPNEFKIFTREYNEKKDFIKCIPLNTELELLPYYQNLEGLCYGPTGLTPFFRFQTTYISSKSIIVLFITSSTYSGDITLNVLYTPYDSKLFLYRPHQRVHFTTTISDLPKHQIVEQCTFGVRPGVITTIPLYLEYSSKFLRGFLKTVNFANDLTFDIQ